MTYLILILHIKPYKTKFHASLELFNELCIWISLYPCLTYSENMPLEAQFKVGLAQTGLTSFQFAVGSYFFISEIVKAIISKLKTCFKEKSTKVKLNQKQKKVVTGNNLLTVV